MKRTYQRKPLGHYGSLLRVISTVCSLIMLAVLLVGCNQSKQSHQTEAKQDQGELPKYTVTKLPVDLNTFQPVAWLEGTRRVAGIQGDRLILLDLTNNQIKILARPAWEATVAPNGKVITFLNEQGVWTINSDGSGQQLIMGKYLGRYGEGSLSLGSWAVDSSKFLIINVYEWNADVLQVELAATKQPLATSILPAGVKLLELGTEGEFLTFPVAWLGSGEILLQKHWAAKQDGTKEYTEAGYRSDLALFRPGQPKFNYLTHSIDGEFVQYLGVSLSEEKVLYEQKTKSNDPATQNRQVLLVNKAGQILTINTSGATMVGLFPAGDQVIYSKSTPELTSSALVVRQLSSGTEEEVARLPSVEAKQNLLFSADGQEILLSYQEVTDQQQDGLWLIKEQIAQ